jgi:spore coat polysaccharide biosynthesis protein SpsF
VNRLLGIVQARMASTRLPGKVLRAAGGQTVLGRVVRAARLSGTLDDLVVATTTEPADDAIVAECGRLQVPVHRGPSEDVLTRFVEVLADHPAAAVARFTADCPLLDPEIMATVANCYHAVSDVDYLSTAIVRTLPRGLDVEIVSAAALRRADVLATGYHRAHVTSYLWSNPEQFRVLGLNVAPDCSDLRLTLDTPEDWELLEAVILAMGEEPPTLAKLVAWLDGHPELVARNAGVVQKAVEAG